MSANYEPFIVFCELKNGWVLPEEKYIHLDGLLMAARIRQMRNEGVNTDEIAIGDVDLSDLLKKHESGVYQASVSRMRVRMVKSMSARRREHNGGSAYQNFKVHVPDEGRVYFEVVGNRDGVLELLSEHIHRLSRRVPARGVGRISGWGIIDVPDADVSTFGVTTKIGDEVHAVRHIPYQYAEDHDIAGDEYEGRLLPPYWHDDGVERIVAPESKVFMRPSVPIVQVASL